MGTISNLVTADHREGEADSAETELLFHCYKYLDCDSCDVSLHEKSVAVSAWCLLLARPHRMLLCLLLQPSQPSPCYALRWVVTLEHQTLSHTVASTAEYLNKLLSFSEMRALVVPLNMSFYLF